MLPAGRASSDLVPLKDSGAADPGAPNREVWLEEALEEKEKLGGVVLDPKEPRTELSTFWPKLNVTPMALLSRAESSVVFLPKENKAAAGAGAAELPEEDAEAGGGGGVAAAGSVFSSEPPSADPAPYCRSMLARCRS